jgi:hypothetical protein
MDGANGEAACCLAEVQPAGVVTKVKREGEARQVTDRCARAARPVPAVAPARPDTRRRRRSHRRDWTGVATFRPNAFTAAMVSITVYASSSDAIPGGFHDVARELGTAIGERGWRLVFGGGRSGLMGTVSRAARAAGGEVVGVILQDFIDKNYHCTETRTMHSVTDMRLRKRGLDEAGDAFVALPGGLGTLEELLEILSFKQLGLHDRPVVVLNAAGYYDPLLAMLERGFEQRFIQAQFRGIYEVAGSATAAIQAIERSIR